MPLRKDLKSVLLIGSGPIVIGQACEFDYSGTQALKALREEGLRLILVNSNPATIMTDPELADRPYIKPTNGPTPCCRRWADKQRLTWRSSLRKPECWSVSGSSLSAPSSARSKKPKTATCSSRRCSLLA